MLPALVAVAAPAAAGARTREYWIGAVPTRWNPVINGMDAISGNRFDAGQTTFRRRPTAASPRASRRRMTDEADRASGVGRIPGPLIRAKAGDRILVHFKNLDTATGNPHSMHFHGVHYEPSSDGAFVPGFSGGDGDVKVGKTWTYDLRAGNDSVGVWPYHDHGPMMDPSIAGGMYGAMSIRGRHEKAPDREFVVLFTELGGFETIDGRAFVGNTPVFHSKVGERVQWDVLAMGDAPPHVPRPRPPLARRRRDPARHAHARPRGELPRPVARGRAGHVALSLSRRVAHGQRHDRPLPGEPMRRSILTLAAVAALAAPATASADDFAISMPGKFFDPSRLTIVAGDQVSWKNADFVSHDIRATNGAFDSGPISRQGVWLHRFETAGSYPLVCSIHPFMTGQIDVLGATLSGPKTAVVAGEAVTLQGRAPGRARSRSRSREPMAPGRRSPPRPRAPAARSRSPCPHTTRPPTAPSPPRGRASRSRSASARASSSTCTCTRGA
jgi:plastocyanin